ncbi:uncharacterized protein LOC143609230 [Bidens hawaiensis]|uniref:uncharacterized protein LOC143609230 n=1 Tax=Bidens hawaiensis TaxID=980011 RepID=UPI00404B656B
MTDQIVNINNNNNQMSNHDFGDPLYLHASDTNNLTIVNIKLIGAENYSVWANSMELALNVKNKIGFIDKTCNRPTTNENLGKQWDRCNAVVLSWILNSISEELFMGQAFSKIASVVWEELKETYSKVDGSIMFNLHQNISMFKQNGCPISEYYHKLTSMWRQFDSLSDLPSCLDNVYQPVRTSILTKDPLPTVKGAFAIISSEESHRTIASSNKSQAAAFASKTSNYKKPRSPLKCTHCNKTGHVVEKCYELVGYPTNYKAKIKNTTSNNVVLEAKKTDEVPCQLTPEQYSKLMIMLNGSVTPDQNTSHVARKFRSACTTSFFTCATPPKEGNCRDWVIDSGANQHMVLSSKNMFDLVDVSNYNMTVGPPMGLMQK